MGNNYVKDFSFIVSHKDLIYFDNAATTQKPTSVIEAEERYYKNLCVNPERGVYDISLEAEREIKNIRKKVADFINCDVEGIIFTSGATQSLNFVALCWGKENLKEGDEVLYCEEDHNSFVLPWKALAKQKDINLIGYKLDYKGNIDLDDLKNKISPKTKIVNVTMQHNVSGAVNDVKKIRDMVGDNVMLNVDAAQAISHIKSDIDYMGVDFFSFSGHKAFCSTGIGVLYVSKRARDNFSPLFFGGGQGKKEAFYNKIECGTINASGIFSLGGAIDYINDKTIENIESYISELTYYLYEKICTNPRIELLYPIKLYEVNDFRKSIVAFNIDGLSPEDVGQYLADEGFCLRLGDHCSAKNALLPKGERRDSVRASLHIYNTKEEIDKLYEHLLYLIEQA